MLGRIVELYNYGLHASLDHGFLVISSEREKIGQVPVDDIEALLVSSPGSSLSTQAVNALLERGASIVLCGPNYHPSAMIWPLAPHHLSARRLRHQIQASRPLKKRLWQLVVRAKIQAQATVLRTLNIQEAGLEQLSQRVGSGDPKNLEAQAARRYWPLVFGGTFRRDTDAPGINALLNYGYAVLRATTARAVATCGLNPTLGIHHDNDENPFCLVDDLMEPFRPVVDWRVKVLIDQGSVEVTSAEKKHLAALIHCDFSTSRGTSPLTQVVLSYARSFAKSLEEGNACLDLPLSLLPNHSHVV